MAFEIRKDYNTSIDGISLSKLAKEAETNLQEYRSKIIGLKDEETIYDNLTKTYQYLKQSQVLDLDIKASTKEEQDESTILRKSILGLLYRLEDLVDCVYICDTRADFVYQEDFNPYRMINNNQSSDEIMEYLVKCARQRLAKNEYDVRKAYKYQNNGYIPFDMINMEGKCYDTSSIIYTICIPNNIKCYTIKINAAFHQDYDLLDGLGHYYFNIVEIKGKKYIVDLTYKQFFKMSNNVIERLGVRELTGCNPGVYMLQTNQRRKVSEELLSKGFIPYTPENLKAYLDGFALSYRNGLYYEREGKVDYNTPYTIKDYERFLKGHDSMVNHEGKEVLCKQLKPLKNPYFKF